MRWLLITLLAWAYLEGAPLELTIGGEAAIIMNAKTGRVLFEKEGHKPQFPASTTKMATALVALAHYRDQLGNLLTAQREALVSITPQAKKQSKYKSPPHWIETDSTHIGIKRGEQMVLYDLLHGLLIASANDAANVIAQNLGGTIPKYMEEVNAYLHSIGCYETTFNNPHGLHHPEHRTTAYDLALMAKKGLEDPIFRRIVATPRYNCPQTNLELERTFTQTNFLLRNGPNFYAQAIGVKTGYTQIAGKNLVAAAQSDDREIIVVALGYRGLRSELYKDVHKMFEAVFHEKKVARIILHKGVQKLTCPVPGALHPLKTYLSDPLSYHYFPSEESIIKMKVMWKIPSLPIAADIPVGVVQLIDDQGTILQQQTLFAYDAVHPTLKFRCKKFLSHYGVALLFLFILISFVTILVLRHRRKAHYS